MKHCFHFAFFPQAKSDGVVIGHDARYNSSRWANLTAAVFLRLGFKVYLFSTVRVLFRFGASEVVF